MALSLPTDHPAEVLSLVSSLPPQTALVVWALSVNWGTAYVHTRSFEVRVARSLYTNY